MSTLSDDLRAQLRHDPCTCRDDRSGQYGYILRSLHWRGSVTQGAPGKTVLRGEAFDGLVES